MNENESGSGPTPPPPPRPAVPPPPPPPQSSSTPPSPPPPPADWNNLTALKIRHRPDRTSQKFHFGIWVGLWISLCMLVMLGLAIRRGEGFDGESMVRALRASFWLCVLSYAAGWTLWRISDRNEQAGQWAAAVGAGLLLMVSIGSDLRSARLQAEREQVAQDLSKTLETVMAEPNPNEPGPSIDTRATVGGVNGEFQSFVKTYLAENLALQNAYNQEMDAAGWGSVLDPQALSRPGVLEANQQVTKRCQRIVAKYRQRWQALIAQTMAKLDVMEAKSAMHREYAQGFRSSAGDARKRSERIWVLEYEIVTSTGDMVSLLKESRGSWKVQSGQFLFDNGMLLYDFNGLVSRIRSLSEEEDALRADSRRLIRQSLESMQSH